MRAASGLTNLSVGRCVRAVCGSAWQLWGAMHIHNLRETLADDTRLLTDMSISKYDIGVICKISILIWFLLYICRPSERQPRQSETHSNHQNGCMVNGAKHCKTVFAGGDFQNIFLQPRNSYLSSRQGKLDVRHWCRKTRQYQRTVRMRVRIPANRSYSFWHGATHISHIVNIFAIKSSTKFVRYVRQDLLPFVPLWSLSSARCTAAESRKKNIEAFTRSAACPLGASIMHQNFPTEHRSSQQLQMYNSLSIQLRGQVLMIPPRVWWTVCRSRFLLCEPIRAFSVFLAEFGPGCGYTEIKYVANAVCCLKLIKYEHRACSLCKKCNARL